jgi:putative phosphonate metabolism protein
VTPRYAVYFAPAPHSPSHVFGSRWLGRDAVTGAAVEPLEVAGMHPERQHAITDAPRRYGFHATLKPPFVLAPGRDLEELHAAFAVFAASCAPFDIAGFNLAAIAGFVALVLPAPSPAFVQLAERAVREFDRFRAAPAPGERERRLHAGLDERERRYLETWGYPYVLDAWRFHLTLTERLDDAERATVIRALTPLAAPFAVVQRIDAVALFEQPESGEPFRQILRTSFTASPLAEASACP